MFADNDLISDVATSVPEKPEASAALNDPKPTEGKPDVSESVSTPDSTPASVAPTVAEPKIATPAAEPQESVEQLKSRLDKETKARQDAEDFGRGLQSKLDDAHKRLAPLEQEKLDALKRDFADEDEFNRITVEKGPLAALNWRDAKRDEIRQAETAQIEAQAAQKEADASFYAKCYEIAKQNSIKHEDYVAMMEKRGGYRGWSYEEAMSNWDLSIKGESALRVSSEVKEQQLRDADNEARRKAANQTAKGVTQTPVDAGNAHPGQVRLDQLKAAQVRANSAERMF